MKKAIYILSLVIALCCTTFAFSQTTPTWQDITPKGWSGEFQKIAVAANDALIAGADNGYIYRSEDAGKSWNPICSTGCSDFTDIAFDKTRMYGVAAAWGKLYYTNDGGLTWQESQGDDVYIGKQAIPFS